LKQIANERGVTLSDLVASIVPAAMTAICHRRSGYSFSIITASGRPMRRARRRAARALPLR